MSKPISTICYELARHAAGANHELLAHILRLAAGEALARQAEAPATSFSGVFDWDVSGDIAHTDMAASSTFSVDPVDAAKGVPIATYLRAFHPDDVASFFGELHRVSKSGGVFRCDYRIIQNERVRWVSAEGYMTLDKSGRPLRLPGVLHDITAHRILAEAPQTMALN